jgi:hypothetical protein
LTYANYRAEYKWRHLKRSRSFQLIIHPLLRGTQAEFPDKGKPAARPGRKAMGLLPGDRQAAEGEPSILRRGVYTGSPAGRHAAPMI